MQSTSWAAGLELIGDDERCVALAGLLPVRLLAERAGLTAGISAAMRRPDHDPDYDRGQVLVDLGLVQLAGGQAIGDFQALAHLEKLIGPVASTPTVWRSLDEADGLRVARIHQAVCRFRRLWWGMLKSRPEGFPWLKVAGRELTGITVIDLDASVVKVASDGKENAKPTYKGGVGFVPSLNYRLIHGGRAKRAGQRPSAHLCTVRSKDPNAPGRRGRVGGMPRLSAAGSDRVVLTATIRRWEPPSS